MYDVIILDLNMPITDGYEACKKIRALYSEHRLLRKEKRQSVVNMSIDSPLDQQDQLLKEIRPIMIACSSDDLESEIVQARLNDAGFDSYLMAPLTTSKVQETVIKLIKERDIQIYKKIKMFEAIKSRNGSPIHSKNNSQIMLD